MQAVNIWHASFQIQHPLFFFPSITRMLQIFVICCEAQESLFKSLIAVGTMQQPFCLVL